MAGAIAAATLLPALSSVTQNNNTKFLPASAPSEHAATLAAPFGTANLVPIPVVAARSGSPLTPADVTAVTACRASSATSPASARSSTPAAPPDGHAWQLIALASQAGGGQNDDHRPGELAAGQHCPAPGCPPGCRRIWPA